MLSPRIIISLVSIALIGNAHGVSLGTHAQSLLEESMSFLDQIYDPGAGYLYDFFGQNAIIHTTRSSPYYATGLLQRNRDGDVEQAEKILRNVIEDQYRDTTDQWYGDYTKYPESPPPGTPAYEAVIYESWDPNWRGFVGTNLVVIYEEFRDLLSPELQGLILESLYNTSVGDTYRVGGVDDDNLYPSYSNPALMRAATAGWTGRKFNDRNMTMAAEKEAKDIIDLFNINNTLSEFNSPTYVSTSLGALTVWATYLPEDSIMAQNGARMTQQIWDQLSSMYNPNLKNLAGPLDRAYGFDMNNYVALISLNIWTMVGKKSAPVKPTPWVMAHANDYSTAPLIAVLAPYHNSLVASATFEKLTKFCGEHTWTGQAYAPPSDKVVRNITSWVSANMTIGAESFDENYWGGPRQDISQWNPAVVQWLRYDSSVGFMNLYPSKNSLDVDVAPGVLNLTYPGAEPGNTTFTFLVNPNPLDVGQSRYIKGWDDVAGVDVSVAGTVDLVPEISFCGAIGGACEAIHGFEVWNFTYSMPEGSTQTPNIQFHFELTP
ncbi:hypothetical protein F5Y15DRAFT_430398 [Xylariaceae sp. FL0016]|nr:hypothetical protein F5Y15DRAFT_430398 [Xylariaceae sp. FL0016]